MPYGLLDEVGITHVMEQANTLPVGSCSSPAVTRRCRAEVGGCYRQLQFPVRIPAALACICSSTRPGKRGQRMRVKRPRVQVGPGPRPAQRLNRLRPTHVAVTPSVWLIAADVPLGHLRRSAATGNPRPSAAYLLPSEMRAVMTYGDIAIIHKVGTLPRDPLDSTTDCTT